LVAVVHRPAAALDSTSLVVVEQVAAAGLQEEVAVVVLGVEVAAVDSEVAVAAAVLEVEVAGVVAVASTPPPHKVAQDLAKRVVLAAVPPLAAAVVVLAAAAVAAGAVELVAVAAVASGEVLVAVSMRPPLAVAAVVEATNCNFTWTTSK
jgi:hypothetical protein